MSILHPVNFHTHTHTSIFPLCVSMPAAHAGDASQDSECLLTGSFSPDGLNDFITINDRDRGTLRRIARCSGTAELPALFLSHPAASPQPSFCAV